jgi:hypothetical protein
MLVPSVAVVATRAALDDVAAAKRGDVIVPAPAGALVVGDHDVWARTAGDGVVAVGSGGLDAERVVVRSTAGDLTAREMKSSQEESALRCHHRRRLPA